MLMSLKELQGYKVITKDGGKGTISSFLFDDDNKIIRYLVVDLGLILPGRKVLISPLAIDDCSFELKAVKVNLTKEQIENSPDISVDRPVSRQREEEYRNYYNWAPYWPPGAMTGTMPARPAIAQPAISDIAPPTPSGKVDMKEEPRLEGDPHLRSSKELLSYDIQATDGEIGHLEDFIADTELWFIRYLIVDTRDWLPGRKVLVAFDWVESVNWDSKDIYVDLTMESVKNSPKYDPARPINREEEHVYYDYYGRPKYWE